jgi:hypothetical protein
MIVQWYKGQDDKSTKVQLPDIGGTIATINYISETPAVRDGKSSESGDDSYTSDIEILTAIAFNVLCPSNDTIETFVLQIGEC